MRRLCRRAEATTQAHLSATHRSENPQPREKKGANGGNLVSPVLFQRVCAGDDLEDLLRDLGLAGAVHGEREALMSSLAFLDALPMAVIRAPCSDAVDSSSAR